MRQTDDHTNRGDESTYALLRARYGVSAAWSIPGKIRWCGYLSFVAATLAPIVASLPASVRAAYVGTPATSTTLAIAMVDLLGVVCLAVAVAGVGLAAVDVRRSTLTDPSEEQTWTLVGFEDLFSGIGFVTGGLSVAVALALAGVGFGGVPAVERLLALGVDPYHTVSQPGVTVFGASMAAAGCGLVVYTLGVLVESLD